MIEDLFGVVKSLRQADSLGEVADVLKREWDKLQREGDEVTVSADEERATRERSGAGPKPTSAGSAAKAEQAQRPTARAQPPGLLASARGLALAPAERAAAQAAALEARLLQREKLDSADVAAAAWLAGHRGDLAAARVLCSLVPRWERTPPASALQAATDWLVLDAAARCAWAEAEWLADGLTTSVATAIHAVAQARPALPALEQALRRARATPSVDPLVAGALAAAVAATRQRLVTVVPRARAQTPLAKAVALHMAVVGRPPEAVSGRLLERLARSWDAVFADPATAEALAARAAALGGGDAGASLASLRDTVVSDLAAVALAAELSLADAASTSALLGDVMDRLDLQVADELGSMARALDRRKEGGERLPTLECLREWVALRVAYERHARVLGLGGRMAAFELVYHSLANQAAALWNKHGLRRLPNAMFAWMAAEAEAVGRSDAARTQAGNKSW